MSLVYIQPSSFDCTRKTDFVKLYNMTCENNQRLNVCLSKQICEHQQLFYKTLPVQCHFDLDLSMDSWPDKLPKLSKSGNSWPANLCPCLTARIRWVWRHFLSLKCVTSTGTVVLCDSLHSDRPRLKSTLYTQSLLNDNTLYFTMDWE